MQGMHAVRADLVPASLPVGGGCEAMGSNPEISAVFSMISALGSFATNAACSAGCTAATHVRHPGVASRLPRSLTGFACGWPPKQIPDATGLIPANIENGLSVGTDCLIMLGILVGMRFVTYLQMTLAIRFHKL